MMFATRRSSGGIALLVTMLTLGACDGDDGSSDDAANASDSGSGSGASGDSSAMLSCADEHQPDAFAVDLSKMDGAATVTIVSAEPAEPTRGDNTWTVKLSDAGGNAMTGATIDVKPWMPEHGHGTPVEEVVTELGDGNYELATINLFMAGYWEVTMELTDASGGAETVMFAVCIE